MLHLQRGGNIDYEFTTNQSKIQSECYIKNKKVKSQLLTVIGSGHCNGLQM